MGGWTRPATKEEIEETRQWRQKQNQKRLADIERFAMKCATIAIDNIITDIVRPGPKPEERECYDVANEIREYKDKIVAEISKAVIVEGQSGDVVKWEYGQVDKEKLENEKR